MRIVLEIFLLLEFLCAFLLLTLGVSSFLERGVFFVSHFLSYRPVVFPVYFRVVLSGFFV